ARRRHRVPRADEVAPEDGLVIPELGQAALVVALALALYGAFAAGISGARGAATLLQSAQHAAVGVFALRGGAFVLRTSAFLAFAFWVRHVAGNTNRGTPFYCRTTAVWGALEGSIILWGTMLAAYTVVVILTQRERAREFYPWVLA